MDKIKPVYQQLLIAAAAVYIIGVSMMLSDLYIKVINVEHTLEHAGMGCPNDR